MRNPQFYVSGKRPIGRYWLLRRVDRFYAHGDSGSVVCCGVVCSSFSLCRRSLVRMTHQTYITLPNRRVECCSMCCGVVCRWSRLWIGSLVSNCDRPKIICAFYVLLRLGTCRHPKFLAGSYVWQWVISSRSHEDVCDLGKSQSH